MQEEGSSKQESANKGDDQIPVEEGEVGGASSEEGNKGASVEGNDEIPFEADGGSTLSEEGNGGATKEGEEKAASGDGDGPAPLKEEEIAPPGEGDKEEPAAN